MSRSYVVFGKVITLPFTTYIFINPAHQLFQFPGTFLSRRQSLFLFGNVAGLLCRLCFLDCPHKLSTIILRVVRNRPEHIGNKGQHDFCPDSVLGGAECPNRRFPVLSACVLWDSLAIISTVDIHLAATIGTVHQPRQRVRLSPAVRVAPDIGTDSLDVIKGLLVDDSLMRILKPCVDKKDTARNRQNKI